MAIGETASPGRRWDLVDVFAFCFLSLGRTTYHAGVAPGVAHAATANPGRGISIV